MNYKLYCSVVVYLLLSYNLAVSETTTDHGNSDYLTYTASYQGLLSIGVKLDIANVALIMPPLANNNATSEEAVLTVTTQDFTKLEMIIPVRFCYRSQFIASTMATKQATWWSKIGGEIAKGQLVFATPERKVTFLHVTRKLTTNNPQMETLDPRIGLFAWANAPDPDRYELHFTDTNTPIMDRLTMLQWLRHQSLTPGMKFDLVTTDGHKLIGFHVEVEDTDQTVWGERNLPSLRIRLQPRVTGKEDASPTWVWLSQDAQRLPLLFRSVKAFGAFEVRLVSTAADTAPPCVVPDAAAGLELPMP